MDLNTAFLVPQVLLALSLFFLIHEAQFNKLHNHLSLISLSKQSLLSQTLKHKDIVQLNKSKDRCSDLKKCLSLTSELITLPSRISHAVISQPPDQSNKLTMSEPIKMLLRTRLGQHRSQGYVIITFNQSRSLSYRILVHKFVYQAAMCEWKHKYSLQLLKKKIVDPYFKLDLHQGVDESLLFPHYTDNNLSRILCNINKSVSGNLPEIYPKTFLLLIMVVGEISAQCTEPVLDQGTDPWSDMQEFGRNTFKLSSTDARKLTIWQTQKGRIDGSRGTQIWFGQVCIAQALKSPPILKGHFGR